jgi:two-component system sensor histidine kinase UhpB
MNDRELYMKNTVRDAVGEAVSGVAQSSSSILLRGKDGEAPLSHPSSRRQTHSRRRQDIIRQSLFSCERRQLAQQIHDDLGGMLTAIKSCLCVAIERDTRRGLASNSLLEDAALLADLAFTTIRKIGVDLRPTLLEQMGMWNAIAWQAASLARRSSMAVTFHTDASLEERAFAEEYARVVFRVLNEAITNAEKHSRATRLNLRIYQRGDFVIAAAEDDGIGARPANVVGAGSLGMVGMREQASEVGGFLTIDTRAGHGMGVYLAIPVPYCYEY